MKARDVWAGWWKENGAKVDLARLSETPRLHGFTLVVLLDQNLVRELGPDKQTRWEVGNLQFPLDAEIVSGNRLLVAEYHGMRVTERTHKGDVVWERKINGPLVAQRLANGNTFIATAFQLVEVDRPTRRSPPT